MATEELTLVINDAQLSLALSKINTIKSAQTRTTTQAKGLTSLINKARKDARAAGISLDDLPTINRDLRLIGGMLAGPGFRGLSTLFFQTRRGVRAQQLAREAEAIEALSPELAKQLRGAALLGRVALVLFAVNAVIKISEKIEKIQQEIIRERGEYESMVRAGLDLTHAEWDMLSREQVGFATAWDAFVEKSKTDVLGALDEWIRAKMVEMTVTPPGYDPAAMPPGWVYEEDDLGYDVEPP